MPSLSRKSTVHAVTAIGLDNVYAILARAAAAAAGVELANHVTTAIVARTATIKRITTVIVGALKDALPHKVPADGASELLVLMFGGVRDNGRRYVVGEFNAGGSGGGPRKDGVDVIETDGSNCMNLPAEALELEAPIRVRRMALRRDSGGAGRFRGGLGCVREFEFLEGEVTLTHRGERHYHAAQGSQGGEPGACAVSTIVRGDGSEETIRSKVLTSVKAGDRLLVQTAGGACCRRFFCGASLFLQTVAGLAHGQDVAW